MIKSLAEAMTGVLTPDPRKAAPISQGMGEDHGGLEGAGSISQWM